MLIEFFDAVKKYNKKKECEILLRFSYFSFLSLGKYNNYIQGEM